MEEGFRSLVAEDEVDARSGEAAIGLRELIGPGEWRREKHGVDVRPSTAGAQEAAEQRTWWATL